MPRVERLEEAADELEEGRDGPDGEQPQLHPVGGGDDEARQRHRGEHLDRREVQGVDPDRAQMSVEVCAIQASRS